jgi:hypothetical protein
MDRKSPDETRRLRSKPLLGHLPAYPAHNQVESGNRNLQLRDMRNQALGEGIVTTVLGKPATALCAVPLLIPVSRVISAHERP